MSQATKSNVNLKYYIKLAVYLLITFGIGYCRHLVQLHHLG